MMGRQLEATNEANKANSAEAIETHSSLNKKKSFTGYMGCNRRFFGKQIRKCFTGGNAGLVSALVYFTEIKKF